MGSFFTISARIEVDFQTPANSIAVLDRMLNGPGVIASASETLAMPDHSFFHGRPAIGPLNGMFNGLAPGPALGFRPPRADEQANGLATLFLPDVRDPLQWEVYEFMDWVVQMSAVDGFVGTSVDTQNHQSVTLFYGRRRVMYLGASGQAEVRAFSFDARLALGG